MNAENGAVSEELLNESIGVCRLCSGNLKLISIFSQEASESDIAGKIEMYLPIKVLPDDRLPLECCMDCVSTILAWHNFVVRVLETKVKLENNYQTSHIQDKEEKDVQVPSTTNLYTFYQDLEDISENDNSDDYGNFNKVEISYSPVQVDEEKCLKQEIRSNDLNFPCNFCPKIFPSEEKVLSHTNEIHSDVLDIEDNQNKKKRKLQKIRTKIDPEVINKAKVIVDDRVYYKCKDCGKSLLSPYTYIWHMRIHTGERPFVCDLCGKQFRVTQGLMRHLRETHERIKNFPCDICGRMFATRRNVDEHRRIHTNERPYICALCGKAFKQKASLFVHNRIHSDTFPFKCDYCNQGFRAKPPLLIHLTKHTGQKPYPCDVCGRYFRIKYELKRHKLVHSEEKPFSCSFCGMQFKQKRYLINHFKANHHSSKS